MSRSVWKGPYVHPSVLKKTAAANEKMTTSRLRPGPAAAQLCRRWLG